jgi:hypothetical protein
VYQCLAADLLFCLECCPREISFIDLASSRIRALYPLKTQAFCSVINQYCFLGRGPEFSHNMELFTLSAGPIVALIAFVVALASMATSRLTSPKQQRLGGALSAQDVVGTWHLLNLQFCLNEDGSKVLGEPAGPTPLGRITFTPEGYMSALITDPRIAHPIDKPWVNAEKDVQLKIAMALSAYCGKYKVSENKNGELQIATQVEISLDPNWIGSKQVRNVRLGEVKDGKQTLVLTPTESFTLAVSLAHFVMDLFSLASQ